MKLHRRKTENIEEMEELWENKIPQTNQAEISDGNNQEDRSNMEDCKTGNFKHCDAEYWESTSN